MPVLMTSTPVQPGTGCILFGRRACNGDATRGDTSSFGAFLPIVLLWGVVLRRPGYTSLRRPEATGDMPTAAQTAPDARGLM